MANTIRIAGAQIPINSYQISYNLNEIKKALDWAADNDVDIIQTPECVFLVIIQHTGCIESGQ